MALGAAEEEEGEQTSKEPHAVVDVVVEKVVEVVADEVRDQDQDQDPDLGKVILGNSRLKSIRKVSNPNTKVLLTQMRFPGMQMAPFQLSIPRLRKLKQPTKRVSLLEEVLD